ncbi:hypothetical protein MKQ70_32250 [Chitinophaga sedimenti]|uniref:hypothetical protein n=1 Tax=Chitinophaga sedimenti TaxID=2033606 RepID=UPI00200480E8|nr:hypothetical protein [Chitinophaga sedimenti]MCK7559390.1 hypothetical protein [Chitinophaga sedimenti]
MIEALLRISIVLKLQTLGGHSNIDQIWIYQTESEDAIPLEVVVTSAIECEVIDREFGKVILQSEKKKEFYIRNFVLSPVSIPEIEKFAYSHYKIREKLSLILEEVEKEQIEKQVGMVRVGAISDPGYYGRFIKDRVANHAHFEEIRLRALEKISRSESH